MQNYTAAALVGTDKCAVIVKALKKYPPKRRTAIRPAFLEITPANRLKLFHKRWNAKINKAETL